MTLQGTPTADSTRSTRVAIASCPGPCGYPPAGQAPFDTPGAVHRMVADVLEGLGLDALNAGSPRWNPIGALVPPGAHIVVKPNWVLHANMGRGGIECLVTHPSVLRAVLDYVLRAEPAQVIVGDAPIQDCDFDRLLDYGYKAVLDTLRARGLPVRVADFRRTTLQQEGHSLRVSENVQPLENYRTIDLAGHSLLEPISGDAARFRVTRYDPRRMADNHSPGRHRYLVAQEILDADLVVNLPKLKTHKKAGITASLKNLVGINGNKDFLPHHRKGAATMGGDNYPRFSPLKALAEELLDFANTHMDSGRLVRECNRAVYFLLVLDMKLGGTGDVEGGWYGNDTVWRMCLDLNRLLLYADREGNLQSKPVRTELSIVDAVIAGEGEGPLKPDAHEMGLILGALNPAAADWVSALLMGLDPRKIPIIVNAFEGEALPIASFRPGEIECSWNKESAGLDDVIQARGRHLRPSVGWRGHCERS